MKHRSRRLRGLQLFLGGACSFLAAVASVHCGGQSNQNTAGNSSAAGGNGGHAGSGAGAAGAGGSGASASSSNGGNGGQLIDLDGSDKDYSVDRIIGDDPPPMSCDGGGEPIVVGGTPECPDDKNLEGCPCPE